MVTYEVLCDGTYSYAAQPFRQGGPAYTPEGGKVWGWDGKTPPTLTPSLISVDPKTGVRLHLFLTEGKIVLLSDSTPGLQVVL